MFWTYKGYDYECFFKDKKAISFNDCYDWSTVMINDTEHVNVLNDCVDNSFVKKGDVESDNTILRQDRLWADLNNVSKHPTITINNITYTGDALNGREIANAICEAYNEAPDECVMAYMIVDPKTGIVEDFSTNVLPNDPDLLYKQGIKDSKM